MVEHFYKYATFDLHEYGDSRTQAKEDDLMNLDREHEGFASPLDMANLEDHDWMQVTYLLRYELPEIFREVLMKLRARYRAYLASLQEEGQEEAPEDDTYVPLKKEEDSDDEEESAL